MRKVRITVNKSYATSKHHDRDVQLIMKKGMWFPSMTSFMEYSGYGADKVYELMERGIISCDSQ